MFHMEILLFAFHLKQISEYFGKQYLILFSCSRHHIFVYEIYSCICNTYVRSFYL